MEVLLVLLMILLLINYVETMVTPALPTIQNDFGVSENLVSWVTTAFTISAAVAAPIMGKFADVHGKKKTLLAILSAYSLALLIAGISPNIYVLILARLIQGIGFSAFPIAVAIITDMFPPQRIATAQGILSATFGIGTAAGLSVGAIIDQDLGWQMAFHISFVGSIVILAIAAKVIPESPNRVKESIDYVGMTLIALGTGLILVYISEGPNWGWLSGREVLLLTSGLILTYAFVIWESIAREPMLKLDLFKIRNFAVANAVGMVSGIAMFLLFFGVIYYAQLPWPFGLGKDQISAGMAIAPGTLGMLIVGPLVGRLINRVGPKPILIAGGMILILGFYLNLVHRSSLIDLTINSFFTTIGIVMMMIPLVNMVSVSLPPEARGVGMGVNTQIRQIGASIGPVLASSIMTSYESSSVMPLNGNYLVEILPGEVSFNELFTTGILITLVALAISALAKNYKLEERPVAPGPLVPSEA
jgi:EmrB/QacA subfamily drug resistance transporter